MSLTVHDPTPDQETWRLPGPLRPVGFTSAPMAALPVFGLGVMFGLLLLIFGAVGAAASVTTVYGLLAVLVWASTIEFGAYRPAFVTELRLDHEGLSVGGDRTPWDVLEVEQTGQTLVITGLSESRHIETSVDVELLEVQVARLQQMARDARTGHSDIEAHVALEQLFEKVAEGARAAAD